jgi:hypothetical protein
LSERFGGSRLTGITITAVDATSVYSEAVP